MKKTLGILFLIPLVAFFSCKKEDLSPDFPFTITVKTYNDSIRVNNIRVEVFAPIPDNIVYFEGYTNDAGQVSFEYDKEAVFLVRATRGTDPYTYIGCADIRLQPNEEVFKDVYLKPYNPEAPGCTYNP